MFASGVVAILCVHYVTQLPVLYEEAVSHSSYQNALL